MQQHIESEEKSQKDLAETLFHRHASAIFAFLRQQCPSREDAEDILLEIFTAALERKDLHLLPSGQQQMFLWAIVRNKQIDAHRRNQRRPSVSIELMLEEDLLTNTEQETELTVLRLEEYAQLHSVVQTLSPLQQKLLHLRFVRELRSPQIARLVGKSETAVRSMISRTLNQLRQLYREEGEK